MDNQQRRKVLRLHAPQYAHPYWQRNAYIVEMPDGTILHRADMFPKEELHASMEVEITVRPDGVYAQMFSCSSGGGKRPWKDAVRIVPASFYDEIEYVGEIAPMSSTLLTEVQEMMNG